MLAKQVLQGAECRRPRLQEDAAGGGRCLPRWRRLPAALEELGVCRERPPWRSAPVGNALRGVPLL